MVYDPQTLDDEDELSERARQYPYPRVAHASLSALLPKDDSEMDERWRTAENQALDRAKPEGPYGVAEGVRDFAPMAIGTVLDLLVNKGKGLGTLAAGGMQAMTSERARRDAAQEAATKQALAMRQQRAAGGDQAIGRMHALLRGQELALGNAKLAADGGGLTPEQQQRKIEAELGKAEADADLTQAQALEKWTYPGLGSLLNVARFQESVMQHGIENTRNKEEETRRKQQVHDQKFDRFNTRTTSLVPVAQMLRTVDETIANLRATDPNADIPGIGGTSWVPFPLLTPEGKVVRNSTDFMEQVVARKWSGAAIPAHEMKPIQRAIRPGATDEDYLVGLEALRRVMLGEIRRHGQAAGEEIAREALDVTNKGLYNYVYGIQDPEAEPKKPSGPSMVSPDAPPHVRGTQPLDQPQPSAAPPSVQPTAAPAPRGPSLEELWAKIPVAQRPAVAARLAALPEAQRYDVLAKLASGIAPEPDPADPAQRQPPARPTRPPPAAAPSAPSPTPPPAGEPPEPDADLSALSLEELQGNVGDPRYLNEYMKRLNQQFEKVKKVRDKPTDQLDVRDEDELKEYDRRMRESKRLPGKRTDKPRAPTAGEPTDEDLRRLPEDKLNPSNPRHAREIRRRRSLEIEQRVPGVRRRGDTP